MSIDQILRISSYRTVVLVLVAFCSTSVSASSTSTDTQGNGLVAEVPEDFAQDLRRADGTPRLLTADLLTDVLAADYESLRVSPGVRGPRQIAHELATDLIERSHNASHLDADGCIRSRFTPHRELAYLQPPEAFDEPSDAGVQTPLDLASQAPEILVVEVEAAASGVFGSELGTLVRFHIEEWIKRDAELDRVGEPAYFFGSDVWLTFGSTVYCLKREGVQPPRPGDRYVIFGKRNELVEKFFWTGNIFPLDGDVLLPQPYPLMDVRFSTSLESLRRYED